MAVDSILEAGGTLVIDARHRTDIELISVGQDEPLPGDEKPVLVVGQDTVVNAGDHRPLRNEKVTSRHRVIDIFSDSGGQHAREIRVRTGHEHCRHDRASRHFVRRKG